MLTTPPKPSESAAAAEIGLPIAWVERETGLPKETLRVWERRYGFPRPQRDRAGERLYSAEELQQLQLIRRLLDAGHRPGKVVGLALPALQALLGPAPQAGLGARGQAPSADGPAGAVAAVEIETLLQSVAGHAPEQLRHLLHQAQQRLGLATFITGLLAPLTHAVGQAWAEGRFEVFEEHLYTEVVIGQLRQAIATLVPAPIEQGPRVLLTTLPGEPHGLGLLMVEALLALHGARCVSLGTQTPLADVVRAAQAHRADVVALSFSAAQPVAPVQAGLRELRTRLPAATALWVGGACAALYPPPAPGIVAARRLDALPAQLAQWRLEHPRSPETEA